MNGIILIVEDHDAVRESLRVWLSGHFPQCSVIEAASGEEAVELAAVVAPSVAVMDISMPGMNGIEATRIIKNNTPATHIIMLSIHEESAYRADAAVAGASVFVPKRLMQTLLLPAVELAMARATGDLSSLQGATS